MSEPTALEISRAKSELFGCWCKKVATTGDNRLTRYSAHCSSDPSTMTRLSSHEPVHKNARSKRTEAKDAEETNIRLQTTDPEMVGKNSYASPKEGQLGYTT